MRMQIFSLIRRWQNLLAAAVLVAVTLIGIRL